MICQPFNEFFDDKVMSQGREWHKLTAKSAAEKS